jgi:transposase
MGETRGKFGADFREGAIRVVRKTGKPIAQMARELGIDEGTFGKWVNADRHRRKGGDGQLSDDERAELARLRKENAELAMECDVLKRSVALRVHDAMSSRSGVRQQPFPGRLAQQRLDDVKWHLIRYDNLRISLASRGALVLSADALIAAGATVLAVQRISQRDGVAVTTAVAIIGILSLLCVGFSVTFAARAIANIRPWQSVVKESIPRGIFFDASDTASAVESFQEFEYLLNDADEDAILRYATINLWKCIRGYRSRYARLRISLRFLLAALWIFLSAVVLQFSALALHF